MKLAVSLLLVALALGLSGCADQLVVRRNLYSPKHADGYWTKRLDRFDEGVDMQGKPLPKRPGPGPKEGIFGISHPDPMTGH